jgi:hypothetical protein
MISMIHVAKNHDRVAGAIGKLKSFVSILFEHGPAFKTDIRSYRQKPHHFTIQDRFPRSTA